MAYRGLPDDFLREAQRFMEWYDGYVAQQAASSVPPGAVDPMNVTLYKDGTYANGKEIGIPLTPAQAGAITRCEYVEWDGWLPMFLVPVSRHGQGSLLCVDARTGIPPLGPSISGLARILMPYPTWFQLMSWSLVREVVQTTPSGTLLKFWYGGPAGQVLGGVPLVFVRAQCPSTKKPVLLHVPPTVQTVREGLAWTFDIPEYQPVEET